MEAQEKINENGQSGSASYSKPPEAPSTTPEGVDRRSQSPDVRERLRAAFEKGKPAEQSETGPKPAQRADIRREGEGERTPLGVSQADTPSASGGGVSERMTVKDAAAKLEIEPEAFYQNLTVTAGDGRTASFQEVKDAWERQGENERVSAEREAEYLRREAKQNADYLASGLLAARGELSRETAETLQTQMTGKSERIHADFLTLANFPDDGARIQFENAADQVLDEFGINPHNFPLAELMAGPGARLIVKELIELRSLVDRLRSDKRKADTPPGARKPQSARDTSPASNRQRFEAAKAAPNARAKIAALRGK